MLFIKKITLTFGTFRFELDELKWTIEETTIIAWYVLADLLVKFVGYLL